MTAFDQPPRWWSLPKASLLVPLGLLAAGIVIAVVRLAGAWSPTSAALAGWLPIDGATDDARLGWLAVAGFAPLLLGLLRRKRLAWGLAVATFGVAGLGALTFGRQPTAIVLLGLPLAILVAERSDFGVRTGPRSTRLILGGLIGSAIAILAVATLAAAGPWISAVGQGVGVALGVGNADALLGSSAGSSVAGALILARILVVIAAVAILATDIDAPTTAADRARALALASRHGGDALLPFQLAPDKQLYAPPNADGCVSFGRSGRVNVVLGDPLGPVVPAWQVFGRFIRDARRRDRLVGVYQVSEQGRRILEDAGWRTFLVGHEAIVDLEAFDLGGPRRANLRHTITRARKGGSSVRWFPTGIDASETELRSGMASVDEAWRRRSGPEMAYSIGRYADHDVGRVATSVAVDADGRVLAFATFRETDRAGGWVLDLLRRRRDGPPGALESCIATAATELHAAGARRLSLGLAPVGGLGGPGAKIEERLLAAGSRAVRRWYDVAGLRFFKAKFDPCWQPRYAAVPHAWDGPALGMALLLLHFGGIRGLLRAVARR